MILAFILLSIGVNAQEESFVRQYDSREIYFYNDSTSVFELAKSNDLATTIFFNIEGSTTARIEFSDDISVFLYEVIVDSLQNDSSYTSFTGVSDKGAKVRGALGDNWFTFLVGETQIALITE